MFNTRIRQLAITVSIFSSFTFLNVAAFAQSSPSPASSRAGGKRGTSVRSFVVRYASSPWNKSSKQIDSAFLFVRDRHSGKLVKMLLDESAPDSAIFSGQFAVNWNLEKPLAPEVYIPPQNMRDDPKAVERFNALLQQKKIKAQPLLIRTEKTRQVLEVYDDEKLATRARELYKKELAATAKAEKTKNVKAQAEDNSLQVAKMTEQAVALAKLAKEAAQRETDRLRLEQLEQQRLTQLRADQARLAGAEKRRRQQQAAEISEQAVAAYQKSDFATAEKLFRKAVELDPDNKGHYFMYGVSLYRTEKLDEALVTLKNSDSDTKSEVEKKYYIGLIHFRLKELEAARVHFAEVRRSQDPTLAPSAAFYEGLVLFSEDSLDKARSSFEYVLDNSKDPALDKKAEEYIEMIAQMQQFRKMAAKKIFLNANAGLTYDSNILQTPDNDTGTTQVFDKGGGRWTLGGDAEYRFFFKEASDFSAKLAVSNTQSFSTDFVAADPLTYTLTAPYSRKGVWRTKGYKLTFSPGYENLHMDYDRSGAMTKILTSLLFNTDFMLVMKNDWFSSTSLEVRRDDSEIAGVEGSNPENADAIKVGLKKTETFFLDDTKKRAVLASGGLVMNNAEGANRKYQRLELSTIYTAPLEKFKDTSWNTGLSLYIQDYPDHSDSRKDTNITLLFGVNRMLNETWGWSASGTYSKNGSSLDAYDYSKYTVLGGVTFSWSR